MAQNFYIGLGQGYTDGFNVSSDVLDAYRNDLSTRGVKLNASDTPAFASDFIDYIHRTKTPLPNPNGISYSDFGNLMATFGNGGAGLLNYVTQNPTGAVNYQTQPDGTMKVIAGAAPPTQSTPAPAQQQSYTPAYKAIILANGQEVNYDYAQPQIKAAADAGQYKIKDYAAVGTPPAGGSAPAPSQAGSSPTPTSNKNIYNPSTGQWGYQVPGAGLQPGWEWRTPGSTTTPTAGSTTPQTPAQPQPQASTPQTPAVQPPAQALQPGMTGTAVKQLQDYLVSIGLMTAQQVATGPGIYGPQTTAAVKALQAKLGVDNSTGPGFYGPRTIAAVQSKGSALAPAGTGAGAAPGGTTSSTTGGAAMTPVDMLHQILNSAGVPTTPQSTLEDIVKQVSKAYGIDSITAAMKTIDDKYADDVQNINDDPWISEGIRVKKIQSLKDKYDMKKQLYLDELKLTDSVVGKAIQLYTASKDDQQQLLLKALDYQLQQMTPTKPTTDIQEYEYAKQQGYSGTLLDFQTQQANLKAKASGTGVGETPTKSGKLVYSAAAHSEDSAALNKSRGEDGYVDPNIYLNLYKAWTNAGGTLEDFLTTYPPKNYVNPANTWLPKYLMPKVTGSGFEDL